VVFVPQATFGPIFLNFAIGKVVLKPLKITCHAAAVAGTPI